MEDYNPFDLDKVNEEKKEEDVYVSKLGNFSWQQERLILFGRSKLILTLNILVVLGFIFGLISTVMLLGTDLTVSNEYVSVNLNWMKFIVVLAMLFSTIYPLAITKITLGSRSLNIKQILSGMDLLKLIVSILYIILVIAAIATGFGMLFLLMDAFLLVVFLGVILFIFFYVYFKFLNKAKEVVEATTYIIRSNNTVKRKTPDAVGLRPYLIAFLILTILNKLFDLAGASTISETEQEVASVFGNLDVLANISFVYSLFVSIFVIFLLGVFDEHMRKKQPRKYKLE